MPDNPFGNPALSAMTGQLAQAWQSTLDTWWKALLDDRGRLAELAKHLGAAGAPQGEKPAAGANMEDLGRVIEALEIMQTRLEKLEGRMDALGATMETMVTYLEQQTK